MNQPLLDDYLYGAPPIQPSEAPSSWVVRLACNYGWTAEDIAVYLGWPEGALDLDIFPMPPLSGRIGQITGLDDAAIMEALRIGRKFADIPTHNRFARQGTNPWQCYCPLCLETDSVPYFRFSWRFTTSIICERHHVALRETCPHCGKPLVFPRHDVIPEPLDAPGEVLRYCGQCSGDIAESVTFPADGLLRDKLLRFQKWVWQTLHIGYVRSPRFGVISAQGALLIYMQRTEGQLFMDGDNAPPLPPAVNWRKVLGDCHESFLEWLDLNPGARRLAYQETMRLI